MRQRRVLALGALLVGLGLGLTALSRDAAAGEVLPKTLAAGEAVAREVVSNTMSGEAVSGNAGTQTIKISASKFEFTPHLITLKRHVPYLLQITTTDRSHGFNIPSMHLRADVEPGKTAEVKVTPDKTGTFEFYCDIFCGSGHEDMSGQLRVTE